VRRDSSRVLSRPAEERPERDGRPARGREAREISTRRGAREREISGFAVAPPPFTVIARSVRSLKIIALSASGHVKEREIGAAAQQSTRSRRHTGGQSAEQLICLARPASPI
jgi:hypothetical protein